MKVFQGRFRRATFPTQGRTTAIHGKGMSGKAIMHEGKIGEKHVARIYCSNTLSCSCLDCSKEVERKVSTLRAEYSVEGVIERESVGKLGTVTDLASVSLRSISAGLKPNTTSCSTLLRTYSYSETLSSQDQMLMTSNTLLCNGAYLT